MKIFTKLKKLNNNNNDPAHLISIYTTYIQKQSTHIINQHLSNNIFLGLFIHNKKR